MSDAFIDNRGEHAVASVGPFESYPVTVNGWTVPFLEMRYSEHGVTVTLDHRYALDLDPEDAGRIIEWVANAIAVAMGWSCHPPSPDWDPPDSLTGPPSRTLPWRRMHRITDVEPEQDNP